MILSLDPSLTRTGWTVLGFEGGVLAAGVIRPDRRARSVDDRIESIVGQLGHLLMETSPEEIVIEVPSGHAHRGRHRGGGAGLAIYGRAVQAVVQECRAYCLAHQRILRTATETEWIRGLGGKLTKDARKAIVATMVPDYRSAKDPGGDIADAIRIGQWWARQRIELKLN